MRHLKEHTCTHISILAVLADRDLYRGLSGAVVGCISILAVLADRDMQSNEFLEVRMIFQSSRSLRTATTVK